MAVKSSAILTLIRIDDASIRSATAPSDTTKLWFDTTTQTLKRYDSSSGTWEIVNDYADDMNNMRQEISVEYNSAITQLKNSLTSLVEELQTTTTNNTTSIVLVLKLFKMPVQFSWLRITLILLLIN